MNILQLIKLSTAGAGGEGLGSLIGLILPILGMVAIFYFLIYRPEKKRGKEMQSMLDNVQIADEIVTTGGIVGRVISIKEDTLVIETSSTRTKIRIVKSAVAKNNTEHDIVE